MLHGTLMADGEDEEMTQTLSHHRAATKTVGKRGAPFPTLDSNKSGAETVVKLVAAS
jgi:hypothetical protein